MQKIILHTISIVLISILITDTRHSAIEYAFSFQSSQAQFISTFTEKALTPVDIMADFPYSSEPACHVRQLIENVVDLDLNEILPPITQLINNPMKWGKSTVWPSDLQAHANTLSELDLLDNPVAAVLYDAADALFWTRRAGKLSLGLDYDWKLSQRRIPLIQRRLQSHPLGSFVILVMRLLNSLPSQRFTDESSVNRVDELLEKYNARRHEGTFRTSPFSLASLISYCFSPVFNTQRDKTKIIALMKSLRYLPVRWRVRVVAFHLMQLAFHFDGDGLLFDASAVELFLEHAHQLDVGFLKPEEREILERSVAHLALNTSVHSDSVKKLILDFGSERVVRWLRREANFAARSIVPLSLLKPAIGTKFLNFDIPEPIDDVILHPWTPEHQAILQSIVEQELHKIYPDEPYFPDSDHVKHWVNQTYGTSRIRRAPYDHAATRVRRWEAAAIVKSS